MCAEHVQLSVVVFGIGVYAVDANPLGLSERSLRMVDAVTLAWPWCCKEADGAS